MNQQENLQMVILQKKEIRTVLVLAANSIAIGRPNKLRFFYQRIKAKKGHKKAIVALARKLASIIC